MGGYVKETNFDLYNTVIESMIKGGQHPETIIEVIRKMHTHSHEDYTEEQLHDWIYGDWEAMLQMGIKKTRPITTEVNEYIKISNGSFGISDCYNDLMARTKEERAAIRRSLARLCQSGVIERVGTKDGVYRKLETTNVVRTKFIPGIVAEFPVILPIDLNVLCKVHGKNIIIIAGTKSSGKTAFLMKIALENQSRMPVVYLNSEMGDEEYTSRMKAFGVASEEEIQYETIECHSNYHDHIQGDKKIYIIDFMEVHDKFYEVAGAIRQVHEKLKDGICIIGIQKAEKAVLGRGAEFSMEKSRIYINIDYLPEKKCSRFTIADAKMPKRQGGVKGAFRDVKIINGARFSPVGDWNFPHGDKI
jgi:Ni2+-binding GTPase involved in maturation of urease and hydrogenase